MQCRITFRCLSVLFDVKIVGKRTKLNDILKS